MYMANRFGTAGATCKAFGGGYNYGYLRDCIAWFGSFALSVSLCGYFNTRRSLRRWEDYRRGMCIIV
jgi:hypothetical protein